MRVVFLAAAMVLGAPFLAGASEAQESEIDKIHACSAITDAGQRLACFDATVAAMKQAQAAGDVSVVSRAQIQQAGKNSFGLGPTAQASAMAGVATAAEPPPEPDHVAVTIVSAKKRENGKFRFTLDDGQIWDQTDTVSLRMLPSEPFQGEIRRAALGSFMLKPADKPAVRVKRVK
jgi:hypothetical protein